MKKLHKLLLVTVLLYSTNVLSSIRDDEKDVTVLMMCNVWLNDNKDKVYQSSIQKNSEMYKNIFDELKIKYSKEDYDKLSWKMLYETSSKKFKDGQDVEVICRDFYDYKTNLKLRSGSYLEK